MDGQQLITIVLAALAAAYLVIRTYRRWTGRPASGCSACSGCDAARAVQRRPFFSADGLAARGRRPQSPAPRDGGRPDSRPHSES